MSNETSHASLRRSKPFENDERSEHEHLPSPQSKGQGQKRKQKRTKDITEPSHKRRRSTSEFGEEVRWEEYFGQWPPLVSEDMVKSRPLKRSRSYTQRVRDGDSPAAWTHQHAEKMQEAGLIMNLRWGQTKAPITDECEALCKSLLRKKYPLPDEPAFRKERFSDMLERVEFRNEARVVRDVLPFIVPSAELLQIDNYAKLDRISEAINAEWACDTLCGPKPKPDFVAGIAASAFADEDKHKLQLGHTSYSPNLFPENMYFPFLICEAKSSNKSIEEAERQAMHSASIATRAIIQLYKQASIAAEVDRKLLVFSVALDHKSAGFYGHYAKIEGEKITFFRRMLHKSDFLNDINLGKWDKPYQITRAIYQHFFPKHLARIEHALLQIHLDESMGGTTPTQLSTYDDSGQFKKPTLPSTSKLQQENDKLLGELLLSLKTEREQRELMERQMAQKLAQQRELMERQMAQQLAQQRELMERQMAQQLAQQRELMERQMAQQLAQQKEEAREQRELMERQMVLQLERLSEAKQTS